MMVGTIAKLVLISMPGPIPTYYKWEVDDRKKFHARFLDRYKWLNPEDEPTCLQVLDKAASVAYGRGLGDTRDDYIKLYGLDTNKWKNLVPYWCTNKGYWDALCDYWGTPEWMAMSARHRVNRIKAGRVVTHYSGSASAYKHIEYLTDELGRKPTFDEIFVRLHVKGKGKGKAKGKGKGKGKAIEINEGGDCDMQIEGYEINEGGECEEQPENNSSNELEFACHRSKKVFEKVIELRQDPEYSGQTDEVLYLVAASGPDHGRNYGFGSKLDGMQVPNAITRGRPSASIRSALSSISAVQQPEQQVFTQLEVRALVQEQHSTFTEEWERIFKIQSERNQHIEGLLMHVFSIAGKNMPTTHVQFSNQAPAGTNMQGDGVQFTNGSTRQSYQLTLQLNFNSQAPCNTMGLKVQIELP